MRKFCFFCFILLFSSRCPGQNNFKRGYVVLNSGDTLRGEIDYGNWAFNPDNITFRNNESRQLYNTGNLKAFAINEEDQYVRYNVTYQLAAADLPDAKEIFDAARETKEVWLRVLYRAKYSLYELNTPKREYFFVDPGGEEIKELVYRVRLTNGQLQKDEQYKNLLLMYAEETNNSIAVQKKLETADYNNKDLLLVFALLNNGKNSFENKIRIKAKKDICAGGMFLFFSTAGELYNDGSGAYAIYTATFQSSFSFKVGCGITYFSQRNLGRLQSRLGLNFANLPLNGENNTGTGSFQKEKYSGSFFVAEPNVNILVSLNPGKQTRFLIGPTLGYNIILKNNLSSKFENPGILVKKDNFPPANGGFVSAGLNFSLIGEWGKLNLQLYHCTNLFDSPFTTLRANAVSLTYGYVFKK